MTSELERALMSGTPQPLYNTILISMLAIQSVLYRAYIGKGVFFCGPTLIQMSKTEITNRVIKRFRCIIAIASCVLTALLHSGALGVGFNHINAIASCINGVAALWHTWSGL